MAKPPIKLIAFDMYGTLVENEPSQWEKHFASLTDEFGLPVDSRTLQEEWRFRLHSKVAALDSLGKHLGIFREPSVQEQNAQVNIQRVEIHLDHGQGGPPVVETHATEVEALSAGDTESEAYPPPADEGGAG